MRKSLYQRIIPKFQRIKGLDEQQQLQNQITYTKRHIAI